MRWSVDELKSAIQKTPGLKKQSIEFFEYKRIAHLDRLLEQAHSHHYSTFYLYDKGELDQALCKFRKNLLRHFSNRKNGRNIRWVDENVLVVIRK